MASALPSAEVAADFKDSLEDLQMNNRYEISNLTIIAKENTEHAMAISRVLEHHIKTTPAMRKLPALYVLDSIVKNVGSPYTLFLGRNLYNTFMDAYTQVDGQTRKNMENMLRTWKEPVPGSMDDRPVFPLDTTRAIENALLRARTAFVQQQHQQQQQQARAQRPAHALPPRPAPGANIQWQTPTPPHGYASPAPGSQYPQGAYAQQNGYAQHQVSGTSTMTISERQLTSSKPYPTQYPQPGQTYSTPPTSQQNISYAPPQQSHDQARLLGDLEQLVFSTKQQFAANPYDAAVQAKLKALLDLQGIITTQTLPPQQWQEIRNQVTALSQQQPSLASSAQTQPSYMPSATPTSFPQSSSTLPPHQQYPSPSQAAPEGTPSLAQLLASAAPPRPTPPPQAPGSVVPPPTSNANNMANVLGIAAESVPSSLAADDSLLASLRASGLLPPATPEARTGSAAPRNSAWAPPASLATSVTPLLAMAGLTGNSAAAAVNDVQLTAVSLKISRPQLLSSLYGNQPSQCSTCGRRFPATETGKSRKARHLDFHFRSNQRLAESVRRGSNRSWFVDEVEWIRFRELDDAEEDPDVGRARMANGQGTDDDGGAATRAADTKKRKFIRAPAGDATLAAQPCPICQDKFETVWHDEAQEWVWMDAVKVGGRIYHESCRNEVVKDGGTPVMTEPVLGKRKAEDDMDVKVKRELLA